MSGGTREHGEAVTLTSRQSAALSLFIRNGELNEGMMADLWPVIRRARLVTNSLVDKGLVRLGEWWDEETGYELYLTDAGRAALRVAGFQEVPDGR